MAGPYLLPATCHLLPATCYLSFPLHRLDSGEPDPVFGNGGALAGGEQPLAVNRLELLELVKGDAHGRMVLSWRWPSRTIVYCEGHPGRGRCP